MKILIEFIIFFLVLIYTTSFAVYEFKRKNRVGTAAIIVTELFSALLFANYMS